MLVAAAGHLAPYGWPDRRAGLAVEDRDLLAEARNEVGTASAWFEAICSLYPGRSITN
jgi:hypothetical protein